MLLGSLAIFLAGPILVFVFHLNLIDVVVSRADRKRVITVREVPNNVQTSRSSIFPPLCSSFLRLSYMLFLALLVGVLHFVSFAARNVV